NLTFIALPALLVSFALTVRVTSAGDSASRALRYGRGNGARQLASILPPMPAQTARTTGPLFLFPGNDAGENPVKATLADINEDGLVDIVVASNDAEILLARPDGTYDSRAIQMLPYAFEIAIADFNLDGHLDLASSNQVRLGHGDGTF